MSQNELQRVVAEMREHWDRYGSVKRANTNDWASRIESAQAVAPGGITAEWVAGYLPAPISGWQGVKEGYEDGYNDAAKNCADEVRHAFAEWNELHRAAAPASEAVGDDDVTDDPTTDQLAFARGYACGVRDTGAQDRAALLDLADRLERVPAFAARHTNDIAMLRRAAGEPAGKSVADQIVRDAMFGPYGMGVMRIDPSAMFKPAASSAVGEDWIDEELHDIDALLRKLGLDPEDCRTDGGRLRVGYIVENLLHTGDEKRAGELPEPEGSMTWTRSAGICINPEPGYTADQMHDYTNAALLRRAARVEVTEAMIERARDAYKKTKRYHTGDYAEGSIRSVADMNKNDDDAWRAALTEALEPGNE